MDLNIYTERRSPFNFKHFKENIDAFLLANQIKSANTSPEIIKAQLTLRAILEKEILSKEEKDLDANIENTFIDFAKLEKSEIFENLMNNEKAVFVCLIGFTKQYISALRTNKMYYTDLTIRHETEMIKSDIQELFNFSKKCFSLSLKNKKLSFDDNINKEISSLQKEYGFKDIFFRKTLNVRDKIILLKNIETLKQAIEDIAKDLNVEKKTLSLHGLVSVSFEPTLLGYSAANAYMIKEDDSYVISLGKYDDLNSLKESYIHEMAHCFDYSNVSANQKFSYSEKALIELKEGGEQTPIQKIMSKEIMIENYSEYQKVEYQKMKLEIIEVMKEEFDVKVSIPIQSEAFNDKFDFITENYFKLNIYSLAKSKISLALVQNKFLKEGVKISHIEYSKEELELKYKKLEEKIVEVRNKYNYVLSKNVSFFMHMDKKNLIETDSKEQKQYYSKPVEIFARAFELLYKKESNMFNTILKEEEKNDFKVLLKESIEYMSPSNILKNQRKI